MLLTLGSRLGLPVEGSEVSWTSATQGVRICETVRDPHKCPVLNHIEASLNDGVRSKIMTTIRFKFAQELNPPSSFSDTDDRQPLSEGHK